MYDDGYITKSNNPAEFEQGMQRVKLLKRRERLLCWGVTGIGLLNFVVYILLGVLLGLWGTGIIFVPLGGFLVFAGLGRDLLTWLSVR